jgi:hypothetical protein
MNDSGTHFWIYELLHIMNYERSGIAPGWIIDAPEPDLEIRKRAVPPEDLKYDCKAKSGDMDPFYPPVLSSNEGTKDEENYPQEVKNNNDVCCN